MTCQNIKVINAMTIACFSNKKFAQDVVVTCMVLYMIDMSSWIHLVSSYISLNTFNIIFCRWSTQIFCACIAKEALSEWFCFSSSWGCSSSSWDYWWVHACTVLLHPITIGIEGCHNSDYRLLLVHSTCMHVVTFTSKLIIHRWMFAPACRSFCWDQWTPICDGYNSGKAVSSCLVFKGEVSSRFWSENTCE